MDNDQISDQAGNAAEVAIITTTTTGEDTELTARRAIEWLSDHALIVAVGFPVDDPPSPEVIRMLAPNMAGIESELGDLVSRYLMQRASIELGLSGIDISPDTGR